MFDFHSPEVQMVVAAVIVQIFSAMGLAMLAVVGRSISGACGDRSGQRTTE